MAGTHGRVALVTGSSRGLGAVIARRLARDGFAVAVNGRPGDEQAAAIGRAIGADGGAAAGFCADVTDEDQAAGLAAAIAGRPGPVDVLVLNATGPQPEAAVTEVTWAGHLAQLDFFVKSPVLPGRAVLPAMAARRYGRIVHIDSEVAHRPPPGRSAYATAKSAQIGLTLSWARELAPSGITVNTAAPGFIPVERHADVPANITDAHLASVPARRMGTPADIAHAVSFLASDHAGFITGQRIVIDGGRSLSTRTPPPRQGDPATRTLWRDTEQSALDPPIWADAGSNSIVVLSTQIGTLWFTRCRSGRLSGGLGSAAEHQPGQPPHLNDGSGGSRRLLVISARIARSSRLQELAVSLACSQRVVLAGLHEVFVDAHSLPPACDSSVCLCQVRLPTR